MISGCCQFVFSLCPFTVWISFFYSSAPALLIICFLVSLKHRRKSSCQSLRSKQNYHLKEFLCCHIKVSCLYNCAAFYIIIQTFSKCCGRVKTTSYMFEEVVNLEINWCSFSVLTVSCAFDRGNTLLF